MCLTFASTSHPCTTAFELANSTIAALLGGLSVVGWVLRLWRWIVSSLNVVLFGQVCYCSELRDVVGKLGQLK